MQRRIFLAGVVAGVMALGACSGGGSGTPATTPSDTGTTAASTPAAGGGSLTVWVDDTRLAALKDVAAKYQADKGVKINLVQRDFGKMRDDFTKAVPTGSGPDIIIGANDWTGKFVENGVVQPVEVGDAASQFNPKALQAVTYNSTLYGLPVSVENIGLIRNDKLASSTPDTFDALVKQAKGVGTKYSVLIQMDAKQGDPYTAYPLQTSFGAPVFKSDSDGNYTSELGLGGANGDKFAAYLAKLGKEGVMNTSVSYDIATKAFAKGQAPYIIGGPWMIPDFQKAGLKLSVLPIPSAGGQTAAPFLGVQAFFISAKTKNAIAANDFVVNYLGSKDAQLAIYKAGQRTPALTAAAEDPSVSGDPIAKGFADAGAKGAPMPSLPQMDSVWQFWGTTQVQIVAGKGDPAKLWGSMVTSIQKAIS